MSGEIILHFRIYRLPTPRVPYYYEFRPYEFSMQGVLQPPGYVPSEALQMAIAATELAGQDVEVLN